jgi:hypothetical protein
VQPDRNKNLATAGYLFAVLLPLVGLGIGLILHRREDPRGLRVMWVAVAVVAIGVAVRVAIARG